MRKISDTIARLAAMRARQNAHVADIVSSDGLSTLRDFGTNPGALQARYHLPDDLPEGAPLVVVLHGCTQNAGGYDRHSGWSQLADEAGFALLYPEQQRANNANLCFNWFQPEDTARDHGEALSIRQMIEAMVIAHGLDRKRIFVTGLSAGGAMAAAMLATYPDLFAGGGIIAGLAYRSATTIPEAFDRMRGHGGPSEQNLQRLLQRAAPHKGPWPRISIWQGSADHTVSASNAEAIAAQWRGVHQLEKAPPHATSEHRRTRQVWCDPAGEAKIEINMIAGMGHGTPIGDGLGTAGPYMLDVGISSTREIARFWGIAEAGKSASTRPASSAAKQPRSPSRAPEMEIPRTMSPEPSRTDSTARQPESDAHGVKKIIEDALRAAGLMR